MTVVHSLESADALLPRATPRASEPREPRTPNLPPPVDLGPKRPAWSRSARQQERAHLAVIATIAAVLVGLAAYLATLPALGNRHAWLEVERPFVELRLSLAELRAIVSDYRVEHGAYPGCDSNGAADPRWFEKRWQRAIERANLRSHTGGARLAPTETPGGAPKNPINGLATVRFLGANDPWPTAADDTSGWVYRPSTGEIRANCAGKAFGSGPAYWEL